MPMVIKFPKLIHTTMMLCERPYSLLGLGDILVPGLFISFCHNFDARLKRHVYLITSCVAYGVGLFLAFFMLVLTRSGQPALLYLSPCVLLAVTFVGVRRGELRELWDGVVNVREEDGDVGNDDLKGNKEKYDIEGNDDDEVCEVEGEASPLLKE